MLKNINASLGGRDLKGLTQVRKVLSGLKDRKEILSFEKIHKRIDDFFSVSYRIFLKKDMFFILIIRPAFSFNPIKGAEWGDGNGHEATILVNQRCTPRRIQEIVREVILIFKDGWSTEEACHRDIQYLIENDKEVRAKIKEIIFSNQVQDMHEKTDRFLVCTDGKVVPVQIKSGFFQSRQHKHKKYPIPLIRYTPDLLKSGLLKIYVLKICDSYPDYIEYCI